MQQTTKLESFQLKNQHGLTATILNYGAIIQSIKTLDGCELVLGFPNADDYIKHNEAYFGATIGPVANRIANGCFNYQGKIYTLERNENHKQTLHSGSTGFHQVFWQVVNVKTDQLILQYRRHDGSGGFPGNVEIKITFHLSAANELLIDYHASTDKVTPLDITNHTYWNLSGSGTILDDEAQFNADYYLPTDTDFLPTGKIENVEHTYFDFRKPRSLARDIKFLTASKGYNHYFILKQKKSGLNLAATIKDPNSRKILQVSTTQPGFQFYTGNFLQGDYAPYSGFAIETQAYPNAVNETAFLSIFLPPEQIYQHRTCYKITDY